MFLKKETMNWLGRNEEWEERRDVIILCKIHVHTYIIKSLFYMTHIVTNTKSVQRTRYFYE